MALLWVYLSVLVVFPVLGRRFTLPGGGSGVPFPIVPQWGSSLGLMVGSLPFLAESCWFLRGWVWAFPVLCVFVVRAVFALCVFCVFVGLVFVAAVVVVMMCVVCAGVRVWCVGDVFCCLSSPLRAWVGRSVWVWGLCVVVPRQSWLRGLGVVPRHCWLGSGGGGKFPCPLACSLPSSP